MSYQADVKYSIFLFQTTSIFQLSKLFNISNDLRNILNCTDHGYDTVGETILNQNFIVGIIITYHKIKPILVELVLIHTVLPALCRLLCGLGQNAFEHWDAWHEYWPE